MTLYDKSICLDIFSKARISLFHYTVSIDSGILWILILGYHPPRIICNGLILSKRSFLPFYLHSTFRFEHAISVRITRFYSICASDKLNLQFHSQSDSHQILRKFLSVNQNPTPARGFLKRNIVFHYKLSCVHILTHIFRNNASWDTSKISVCFRWPSPYNAYEWTLSSFSWRNIPQPAFLLVTIIPDDIQVNKCLLPNERTIIGSYVIIALGPLFFLFYRLASSILWRYKSYSYQILKLSSHSRS